MRNLFFFFFTLSLLIGVSAASSIYLEESDGDHYLSLTCNQPCKVGAFYIQLNYTPGTTTVESVEDVDTFGIVVDIDNEIGVTKVGGFAVVEEQSASTSIRLARVYFTGENAFEIIVRELYDYDNVKPIPVDNYIPVLTPTPTPVQLPEYRPDPGYVSPGQGGVTYDRPSLPSPTEPPQDVREPASPELPNEEQPAETATVVRTAGVTPVSTSTNEVSHSDVNQTNTTVSQKTPASIVTPVFSILIVLFICYERTSLSIMRRR